MNRNRENKFSIDYLRNILIKAKNAGYSFLRMSEYADVKEKGNKYFILRLDLDFKPSMMKPFTDLSVELGVPYTAFVRVAGPYNLLWYPHYQVIADASRAGCEIGLHTTPVEWATLMAEDVADVFEAELSVLRAKFPAAVGVAPHRDVNFIYNSLPWLDENWEEIRIKLNLKYHAYEKHFQEDLVYVNEGLSPHLGWRNATPEEAIETGKDIHMLLHPHWWFVNHPFEVDS